MNTANKILYFGYGAHRDVGMISAITDRNPTELKGEPAFLLGYELCIQSLDQISNTPVNTWSLSPQEILRATWGESFRSYTVRPNPTKRVAGTLWHLDKSDISHIDYWGLIDLGWYERISGIALTKDLTKLSVITDGLREYQEAEPVVDSEVYETWLNRPEMFFSIARRAIVQRDRRIRLLEIAIREGGEKLSSVEGLIGRIEEKEVHTEKEKMKNNPEDEQEILLIREYLQENLGIPKNESLFSTSEEGLLMRMPGSPYGG